MVLVTNNFQSTQQLGVKSELSG